MTALVEVERRDHVAILWMTDTARRNALSVPLVTQMLDALESTLQVGARGVVIASREKAFCAGADIRDMLENGWLDAEPGEHKIVTPPDLFEAIESDARPVLAAVDGLALGGGVELCLACDVAIAAPTASFMFPELGLGVLPNTALARLPELIGARAAAELILTRRRIDGAEAARLGLVSKLVDAPSSVEQAVTICRDIIGQTPPVAFAAAKRLLRRGRDWSAIRSVLGEMDPAEWREGTNAFVEKRHPDYERFWSRPDGG